MLAVLLPFNVNQQRSLKSIDPIHYRADCDGGNSRRLRNALRLAPQLELNGLRSAECDLSMRRLYGFYTGQMPYMRSFPRVYWGR
jgi:hypothetical protein